MESLFQKYGHALIGVVVGSVGAYGLGMVAKEKNWFPFGTRGKTVEPIKLSKILCHKDQVLIDLLSSQEHAMEQAWVVTNPDQHDNPIIYASCGFCDITGYKSSEIVGRNCRFLQGEKTDKGEVTKIHNATENSTETAVRILNYRKDGTTFLNQLYIAPLHTPDDKVAYFIGITRKVEEKEGAQGATAGKK